MANVITVRSKVEVETVYLQVTNGYKLLVLVNTNSQINFF